MIETRAKRKKNGYAGSRVDHGGETKAREARARTHPSGASRALRRSSEHHSADRRRSAPDPPPANLKKAGGSVGRRDTRPTRRFRRLATLKFWSRVARISENVAVK